jgi:hypothetical protein
MADSALEAIEASSFAHLEGTPGLMAAKLVPMVDLFRVTEDGTVTLNEVELPTAYPGATMSMNDDEIQRDDRDSQEAFSTSHTMLRVAIYVGVFAYSDGTVRGDAWRLAWQYGEQIIKRMTAFTPTSADFPANTQPFSPLRLANIEPVEIDANTSGQLLKFWARYRITATV